MNIIRDRNFWKTVIIVILAIGMLSFAYYSYRLDVKLEQLGVEKAAVETQLAETIGELKADLDSVKSDLETTRNELDAANEKITAQRKEIDQYIQEIEDEEAKWKKRYEEYPVATEAWIAMKTYGWSDTVCAGIMGNLMAETGGTGTLHLDWDSNGGNGYGLVQWIGGRRSTIKSRYGTYPTVKEQIQFVHDELFGANGVRQQVTISQLDAIMTAETPEECAYAFACYYERCANFARGMRRGFARDAYEYFVG